MITWSSIPLVRILIPFIAGILAAVWLPVINSFITLFLFFLAIFLFLFTFTKVWSSSYRNSWWYGLVLNTVLFSTAYQLTISKTDQFSNDHFSKIKQGKHYWYVRIASSCIEKEKSIKVIVELIDMNKESKEEHKSVFGKALVYFQKDARALKLDYGDELIIKTTFREIPGAQNPGEFDYRRFMFHKNIYNQAYLKKSDWLYSGTNTGNMLVSCSICLRNKLLMIFKKAHLKGDEFSVAAALLVGYTDKLDEDILSAYSQTGTLHVLSVSGMHVGIVFVLLSRCLLFLDKIKYGTLLKTLVLIFFLWFYALLTGLSPSVLRSATMFSFIVCAQSFKRNSTIYNTLAASALFLLLVDPYLIMDVGFQLSYLAVAGIVMLQPFFEAWIKTDNWLLKQLLTLTTVSIAAQLATLPLSLYYFHQFPNYFLLSNLLVIPLSTCIIYMGMALLVISGISMLFTCLSVAFSKMVALLNAIVVYMQDLAYGVNDNISINEAEMILMYGFIISLFLYFHKKKLHHLKTSLYILIVGLGLQVLEQVNHIQQKKLIVYAIPKMTAIDLINARDHILLVDTSYRKKIGARYMKQNWCELGLTFPVIASATMKTEVVCIHNEIIQFYTRKLIVLRNAEKTKRLKKQGKSLVVNDVILSGNVKIKIKEVMDVYKPACVVFDLSNSIYQLKKWKEECKQLKQEYYAIDESGAYIKEL